MSQKDTDISLLPLRPRPRGPALVAEVQGRKLKRSMFRGAVRRGCDMFGDLKSNLDNYACKAGPLDSIMKSRDE